MSVGHPYELLSDIYVTVALNKDLGCETFLHTIGSAW